MSGTTYVKYDIVCCALRLYSAMLREVVTLQLFYYRCAAAARRDPPDEDECPELHVRIAAQFFSIVQIRARLVSLCFSVAIIHVRSRGAAAMGRPSPPSRCSIPRFTLSRSITRGQHCFRSMSRSRIRSTYSLRCARPSIERSRVCGPSRRGRRND